MTRPKPDNPLRPPQWSSDDFRETAVAPGGLVRHVPIVAVLLMVQGVLEIGFTIFGLAFVAFLMLARDPDVAGLRPLGLLMILLCIPALGCGVLRIVASYCNFRYRRRRLGMIALGAGLLTMVTGYCAPTAIGLAIYGLIVYLNDSVIAAFRMGEEGRSRSEISAAFPPS